jgi:hypothetical protein
VATPREGRAAKSRKSLAGERDGVVAAGGDWQCDACQSPTTRILLCFGYMHLHARVQQSAVVVSAHRTVCHITLLSLLPRLPFC